MRIRVRMEGHLREYFPKLAAGVVIVLEGSPTVAEILKAAGVPPELPNAVLVNKVRVEADFVPPDGAELVALSPLAGG